MVRSAVLLVFFVACIIYSVHGFNCADPKGKKLQVHLVAHTHDDTGWQITVDQYYVMGVQYIIDTVINELQANPDRKFIYVEIAFFKRWWDEQEDRIKDIVRTLVKNRQLEFINGGWCMNDEAATHYNAIIDQMTLGLRWIEETFGAEARPTVAWHIDPFGHSAEQASLFSMMSFDAFFVGRIDWVDKFFRLKKQEMEMMWRGSRNFEQATQIFTGVLYNMYFPPRGFCYDQGCWDPPIQDNPNLFDYNVHERVDAFVKIACEQAKNYKTNNILITMGQDFNYQNAHHWFKNLDKLIKYMNKDGRINTFYSTPSMYLKALHDSGEKWPIKTDDFMPYSHCYHCYWTGYYSSRPALKAYIRESNNILQACKQMEAIEGNVKSHPSSDFLRRSVAVNQHHDAVTGTEKQHVTNDYAKRLSMGRKECQQLISTFINRMGKSNLLDYQRCDYLNISACKTTETEKSIAVNVYNPLAHAIATYLRVPLNSKQFVVLGSRGQQLKSQIAPVSKRTKQLRRNVKGFSTYELTFEICAPPMGFSTYFLKQSQSIETLFPPNLHQSKSNVNDNFIQNDNLRLEFSTVSGRLLRMIRKDVGISVNVDQEFLWYQGSVGDKTSGQPSGAYIFRPQSNTPNPVCKDNKASIEIIKGPLVEEARQTFGDYVSQVIRLYRDQPFAEFEYTIGPIPVKDKIGKEIISRFNTNIENKGLFYTDANGREVKQRKRGYRKTWPLTNSEPVSENYYPISSRIFINDSASHFTVMTDRSQGGGSIKDGQVELMLHRRLLKDDNLGVGEPLNEPGVDGKGLITRGKHHVILSTPKEASRAHRLHGEIMLLQPIISFASNAHTKQYWAENLVATYSALSKPLPENIHLLTMETTNAKTEIILRLEHLFAKGEDPVLSRPVVINLDGLFTDFIIISITEMNLSANQRLKDKKMMQWNVTNTNAFDKDFTSDFYALSSSEILLKPMEIRTFIATIKREL